MLNRFAAALFACLPLTATAQQPPCSDRETVIELLTGEHGENRHALMLSGNGAVLELWGNVESGSWTITATGPDGRMCLMAGGIAFQLRDDPLPPAGVPG